MTEPTNEPAADETWVLYRLGTDSQGRIRFIINPEADPKDMVAALRALIAQHTGGEAEEETTD